MGFVAAFSLALVLSVAHHCVARRMVLGDAESPLPKPSTFHKFPGSSNGFLWRGITPLRGASVLSLGPEAADGSARIYWPGIGGYDGPLSYFGGPIKTGHTKVHFLFYGAWGNKDADVLTNFVTSISDSSLDATAATVFKWWKIQSNMADKSGKTVTTDVSLGKVAFVPSGYKKTLNDIQNGQGDDILGLVDGAIAAGTFPKDEEAIYVVVTSADIKVGRSDAKFTGGFCDYYCGYHSYGDAAGATVSYVFVGSPAQCASGCSALKGGGVGDMAVSVLAHELAEVATDYQLNAWFTKGMGLENGDACAWTFSDFTSATHDAGVSSNMVGTKGYPYLVQALPDVATQKCLIQSAT